MEFHNNLKFIIIVLGFLSSTSSALYGPSSEVVQLTASNFKSKVASGDQIILVEFYAPWCGHCKSLAPAWEQAAKALKGIAMVAAIDCDEHKSIAAEYGIRGFPTIKAFGIKSSPLDYSGGRDAKGITSWVLSQLAQVVNNRLGGGGGGSGGESSASVVLTSADFEEKVLRSNEPWIVEFFAPWCGHCKNLAPEWKRAAKSLKGKVNLGQVDCTVEEELAKKYGIQGFPTILVFGADKETPKPYEGARTAGAIESFALQLAEESVAAPEVVELTGKDVYDEHCGQSSVCFISFLPDILDTGATGRNKYLETLAKIAEKFKARAYRYVWAEAGKQPELERAVGVGGYGYPAMVSVNVKKMVYMPLKGGFNQDSLEDFVRSVGAGGRNIMPLEKEPEVKSTQAWDGLDGQVVEEEEFSLEELMGGGEGKEL